MWGQGSMTGSKLAKLSYDDSFFIYFNNLPINVSSATGKRQHFKIPITTKVTNIFNENNGFSQVVNISNTNYNVISLEVIFTDCYGFNVNISSYSFTLEFGF
jgi:hypothetical protein